MTQGPRIPEVWILGATGRIGRAIAYRLAARGIAPVLVGRDRVKLTQIAGELNLSADRRLVWANGTDAMIAEITRARPAVVINTLGEYANTSTRIALACMPGGHYIDLANDLVAMPQLLALHDDAVIAGSTLVTGAGFGVLATEAVVVMLCENRSTPKYVRVDALASVATESGIMGAAFAATTLDVLTTGGRRYLDGNLVHTRLAADFQKLTLPDGQSVKSSGVPSGELLAAIRASGAPAVTATSALAPTNPAVRAALPVLSSLLRIPWLRRLAFQQLARISLKASARPRQYSWGHAVINWPDGIEKEGWLRTADGMDFTADVAVEVASRLMRGEGKSGAYTPGALFGYQLASSCGGEFVTSSHPR